jgi:hypothetical protein
MQSSKSPEVVTRQSRLLATSLEIFPAMPGHDRKSTRHLQRHQTMRNELTAGAGQEKQNATGRLMKTLRSKMEKS